MRGSLTISAVAHLIALALCVVAFAAAPMEAPMPPTMTVNTISVKEFTELTKGIKDAPKLKVDENKAASRQGRYAEAGRRGRAQDRRQETGDQNRHRGATAAAQARSEEGGQAGQGQAARLQARQDRRAAQEGRRQAAEARRQGQSRYAAARRGQIQCRSGRGFARQARSAAPDGGGR